MKKIMVVLMALALYGFIVPSGYAESASDMLDPMASTDPSISDAVATVSETPGSEAVTAEKSGALNGEADTKLKEAKEPKEKAKGKALKDKSKEKGKAKAKGKSKETVSQKSKGKKGSHAKVSAKTSKSAKTKHKLPQ